jgi:hypothetical protein
MYIRACFGWLPLVIWSYLRLTGGGIAYAAMSHGVQLEVEKVEQLSEKEDDV